MFPIAAMRLNLSLILLLFLDGRCRSLATPIRLNVTLVTFAVNSTTLLVGMPYIRPAHELAAREIADEFNMTVNYVSLSHPKIQRCQDRGDNLDIIYNYYYRNWQGDGVFVILEPGTLLYAYV